MAVATERPASRQWAAPGPGRWQRDDEHVPGTVPPYMQAVLAQAISEGFAEGFRNYGLLLERFDVRFVGQRMFGRMRAVGEPENPTPGRGAPPPLMFKLLFRVHPELRFRV